MEKIDTNKNTCIILANLYEGIERMTVSSLPKG
jgi:hypothetical protein